MTRSRKALGRGALGIYRVTQRLWGKAFSVVCAGGFHSFGRQTVIQPPVRLSGERRIAVGDGAFVGPGCWLQVLDDGQADAVAITIGSGTSFAGNCVVSAVSCVSIGERVLFARGVYIADHSHSFINGATPIMDQGVDKIAPIVIDDGAWLGENVVVCPGVHIGRGAVVGANSVVVRDVPARAVAVGAPAVVVRQLETTSAVPDPPSR